MLGAVALWVIFWMNVGLLEGMGRDLLDNASIVGKQICLIGNNNDSTKDVVFFLDIFTQPRVQWCFYKVSGTGQEYFIPLLDKPLTREVIEKLPYKYTLLDCAWSGDSKSFKVALTRVGAAGDFKDKRHPSMRLVLMDVLREQKIYASTIFQKTKFIYFY